MQVSLTPAAQADLEEIKTDGWIDSRAAAERLAAQVLLACMSLSNLPDRGRKGRRRGTRELVVRRRYVVTYRVGRDAVEILQIRHHARLR